jgi:hypothetical protein
MHGQTNIKFLKLTNPFPLLHTNKAHLPSLHPPHFPLLYLERKLLLLKRRADIAWEAEVLDNFLFACCRFSVIVTWSSHNWLTSHSQANPQPHSTSLCLISSIGLLPSGCVTLYERKCSHRFSASVRISLRNVWTSLVSKEIRMCD